VLDSGFRATTQTYERYLEAVEASGAQFINAEPGQNFDMGGGAVIRVLGPVKPFFRQSELRPGGSEANANSVVFRLDHGDFSMLFTGDAEMETEERLIREGANLRARVLKVGHHGSRHATGAEFLRAVEPEQATISVGSNNNYGHPTGATLRRLRDAGVTFYRTDLQGQITITSDGRRYNVTTQRGATQAALNRGRSPR
jgi:competence protein ComEC